MQHCRKIGTAPYSTNDRVISLLHAGTQMLKCANADVAMSMLTQSERIMQDMMYVLSNSRRSGGMSERSETVDPALL